MVMRLIQPGQDRASAAIANQSAIDSLGGSGYANDGSDFAGFGKKDPAVMRFAGAPFYDATHPQYGALADGSHDDRAALILADTAAGTKGILQLQPGTGGYRIASDMTINAVTLRAIPGAYLLPDNNVTVTINCQHIDVGAHLVFDASNGGKFKFTNIQDLKGEWYLKWANGVTSDAPHLNALSRDVAASAQLGYTRVRFSKRLTLALDATWTADTHFAVEWIGTPSMPDGQGVEIRWIGPRDATMISWNHVQHCLFKAFYLRPGYGTIIGVGGNMTVGSPVLTETGFNQFGFGPPIAGRKCLVYDKDGNLVLETTVLSVNAGAAQITLNANAPSNLDTVRYVIGYSATSGPAAVTFDWDLIGPGPITTECTWSHVLFRQDGPMYGHVHLRWSHTSAVNCEFATASHCRFIGGGMSPLLMDPAENGTSVSMTAGDTLVTITGGVTVTNLMPGERVRIPYAGGVDGGGNPIEFDDVMKTYISPTQFRTRLPATTTVSGKRCLIGEGVGRGIENGFSSNALRHTTEFCTFFALEAGIYLGSGSIDTHKSGNTNNEKDVWLENFSGPCHFDNDDSEAARQKFVFGSKSGARNGSVAIVTGCRMPPQRQKPHDGFIACYNIQMLFTSDGCTFDDPPHDDAFIYDLRVGHTSIFKNRNSTVAGTLPNMAKMGYNNIGADVTLISEYEQITDAPAPVFRKYGTVLNENILTAQVNGFHALAAPNPVPLLPDSEILNAQFVPFTDSVNAFNRLSRLGFRYRDDLGNLSTIFPETSGVVELAVVSGHAAVDASKGNLFALHVTSGATIIVDSPSGQQYGHSISFLVSNESAGAINVQWGGAYALLGAGGVSLWVNPAPGKRKRIKFTFYPLWVSWEFESVTPDYSQ